MMIKDAIETIGQLAVDAFKCDIRTCEQEPENLTDSLDSAMSMNQGQVFLGSPE